MTHGSQRDIHKDSQAYGNKDQLMIKAFDKGSEQNMKSKIYWKEYFDVMNFDVLK